MVNSEKIEKIFRGIQKYGMVFVLIFLGFFGVIGFRYWYATSNVCDMIYTPEYTMTDMTYVNVTIPEAKRVTLLEYNILVNGSNWLGATPSNYSLKNCTFSLW